MDEYIEYIAENNDSVIKYANYLAEAIDPKTNIIQSFKSKSDKTLLKDIKRGIIFKIDDEYIIDHKGYNISLDGDLNIRLTMIERNNKINNILK